MAPPRGHPAPRRALAHAAAGSPTLVGRAVAALTWPVASCALQGYWSYPDTPNVDTWKWLDSRRMTNVCERWAQDHTNALQARHGPPSWPLRPPSWPLRPPSWPHDLMISWPPSWPRGLTAHDPSPSLMASLVTSLMASLMASPTSLVIS